MMTMSFFILLVSKKWCRQLPNLPNCFLCLLNLVFVCLFCFTDRNSKLSKCIIVQIYQRMITFVKICNWIIDKKRELTYLVLINEEPGHSF